MYRLLRGTAAQLDDSAAILMAEPTSAWHPFQPETKELSWHHTNSTVPK